MSRLRVGLSVPDPDFEGRRKTPQVLNLLVGYHGELKVNLFS